MEIEDDRLRRNEGGGAPYNARVCSPQEARLLRKGKRQKLYGEKESANIAKQEFGKTNVETPSQGHLKEKVVENRRPVLSYAKKGATTQPIGSGF